MGQVIELAVEQLAHKTLRESDAGRLAQDALAHIDAFGKCLFSQAGLQAYLL